MLLCTVQAAEFLLVKVSLTPLTHMNCTQISELLEFTEVYLVVYNKVSLLIQFSAS